MLVTIQQTKTNSENLYEVSSNDQLLFQAKAPWMSISLPFKAENLRELTFSNSAWEPTYTTRYKFIDNLVEESIPFKHLLTKEQRFEQFEIISGNSTKGSFYVVQNGIFDSKFCIECMGKVSLGYSLDKGKSNYVPIYDGDKQIAQIMKPLTIVDNLDSYFLHIEDEYEPIVPILSLSTVYYDHRKYNNNGEFTKNSVEITTSYTYGKNNDKYNPNWVAEEFGQQTADELEWNLDTLMKRGSAQAKKIVKLVGFIFLILILLAIILFVCIYTFL